MNTNFNSYQEERIRLRVSLVEYKFLYNEIGSLNDFLIKCHVIMMNYP